MRLTDELVLEIAAWVAMQTGLPVGVPTVKELSPIQMTMAVPQCREARKRGMLLNGRCPTGAIYDREAGVVYLGSWLATDEGRSLLAHEFTHRGQHMAGFADPASSCAERRRQEAEAYAVQAAFNDLHRIRWEHHPRAINCGQSA